MTVDGESIERLREMGIGPIWRRRLSASASSDAASRTAAVANAADAVADVAGPAHEPALASTAIAGHGENAAAPTMAAVPPEQTVSGNQRQQRIALLEWDQLNPHIAACTACALGRIRRNPVPGVGSATAQWMFVGEAPGAEEDAKGEPFVGQAGRLLDNMLRAIGLDRARDVYIANVLKCRPPSNRNPEPGEVACCSPYLERQLELIRPRLIMALGRFAAMTLLETDASIASLRGRVHQYRGVPLIVTYHPAYLLRTLPDKAKAWEDLVFARRTFARLQSEAKTPS